jgi:S-DNA-T family DNA segregation ATPase FtsK/SpoIIIE
MDKKPYNFLVLFVFILSFLNLVFYFNNSVLPDNFYEINSFNSALGYFSYYFGSICRFLVNWSGMWIPFYFLFLLIFHTLSDASRISLLRRSLAFVCFPVLGIFFVQVFFPSKLGESLSSLLSLHFSNSLLLIIFLLFFFSFFLLIIPTTLIRGSFLKFYSLDKSKFNKFLTFPIFKFHLSLRQAVRHKILFPKPVLKNPNIDEHPLFSAEAPFKNQSAVKNNSKIEYESSFNESSTTKLVEANFLLENNKQSSHSAAQDAPEHDRFFEISELIACISPKSTTKASSDPDGIYFETIARSIEKKLEQFNISSEVINVLKGPVVDTFELELGAGVKVTGVTNRTDDLSLALMGAPIRMVYPMKGKSTIGIEVPRNPRDVIYLDEVLKSEEFHNSKYKLPVAMGKDAYGDPAVIDLASTPHLLVAGTTGAGKSVFINTLLVSLIIKFSPKQLRLIMLDPKQLELALYQTLPHLVMPVVTDPEIASAALLWAIDEMERRYSLLKDFGVKNIEGFNKKITTLDNTQKYKITKYYEDIDLETFELPYIVIVVDEFADLMLSKSGKAIETSISRLAAKARASGIHIVLATQRPSTDIITGVIKANFPTRVSFRVFTNIDSRVILDGIGAEKLLGKGDMLFKQGIDILRMHSAFINEEEIEALVEKLSVLPSQFDSRAIEYLENTDGLANSDHSDLESGDLDISKDEKYEEAVKCVAMHRVASASFLQRRLGIGYNRAANLIEEMERNGIVGPAQGSKPRKVLVSTPADSDH